MNREDLDRIDRPTNAHLAVWKEMIIEDNEDCIGAGSISMLIAEVERLRTWQIEAVKVLKLAKPYCMNPRTWYAWPNPIQLAEPTWKIIDRVLASAPEVKP